MRARDYWKAVTVDRSGFLDSFLARLHKSGAKYCVVGGQAVNAYVDPVVSLDLDIVVTVGDRERLITALTPHYQIEEFPHSVNLSDPGSDLRVQIQTDPRYLAFIDHALTRDVLGIPLRVARPEDVLQGKIWAASDETRRGSKRQKDLADIARLLETYPEFRPLVPESLQRRLL